MAQIVYGTDSAGAAGRDGATDSLPADLISGDAISSANLDKMDADNDVSHEQAALGDYSWIQIMLDVQEAEGTICSLALHVDGFMDDDVNSMGGGGGVQIHCWNDEDSTWDAIGSQSTSHTETDYDTSITSGIGNYINSDGEIYWRLSAYHFEWDSKVSIDNIDLTVSTGYELAVEVGAFTLTGQAVNLDRIRAILAGAGGFTLTGQGITFDRTYQVASGVGSFSLGGQASTFGRTYQLAIGVGSFALGGQSVAFALTYVVHPTLGTFTLSGQDIAFGRDAKMGANVGEFAFTGQAANLHKGFALAVDVGAFTLTGQAISFDRIYQLAIGAGSFTLGGQAVTFRKGPSLSVAAGTFTLGGQAVTFAIAYAIHPAVGEFALSGQDVAFGRTAKIPVDVGEFTLTGQNVVFSVPGILTAETGAFVLGGQDANLLADLQIEIGVGGFVLDGQDVDFGQRWYGLGRGLHNVLFGAEATGRGLHRCANDALKLFELYMGTDAEPDLTAAPDKTSASLPFDSDALAASHEYRFVTRYRNAWDLVAQNIAASSIALDADGNEVTDPPSAPEEIRLDAAADGAVRVRALYRYLEDDTDVRADRFAIWLTSDGSTPNGYAGPTHTVTPTMADGLAKLDWTSGAYGDGLTIKALVRTQRLL